MTVKSLLAITEWKKENSDVNISNHFIFGTFSSNSERQKFLNDKYQSLKYFNCDADLETSVVQSKINDVIGIIQTIHYNPYRLASKYLDWITNYPANCITTTRSVLSKIMNTPFEINQEKRKWIIKGKINEKGIINLYYDKNSATNVRSEIFVKHDELLKNYLFTKKPQNYYRKVTSVNDEIFGEVYRIDIGDHKVAFYSEISGVISDDEIANIENLRSADHIYYDLIEADDFSPEVINYNPIWWSKAALIKAKQCIIGVYNKDNDSIQEIIKFNIDRFQDERLFENAWSTKAAWNFLNDFLYFVKDEFKRIPEADRENTILKFQSFYIDKPYVVCECIKKQ